MQSDSGTVVEGPDGKEYEFPAGTDKSAAIKYFKLKGIGHSSAATIPPPPGTPSLADAPGGAKSQPPMTHVRTLTGTPYNPGHLERGAVDQMGGAIQGLANVSAPMIAHRMGQKLGIAKPGDMFEGEGSLRDTAENSTVMIGLGAPEGMEGEAAATTAAAKRPTTTAPPPAVADLSPEQRAGYTANLDKANSEFAQKARKYHEDVSKTFDTAKREQLEGGEQHSREVKRIQDKYASDAQTYHESTDKAFDDAKQEQLTDQRRYASEKEQWLKENREYLGGKAEAEKAFNRKQALERGSREYTKLTHDNLQQTYDTARGKLNQRWGDFRGRMEGAELDAAKTYNMIESAKAKYLRGSPASLTAFNNLAREMGIQEFMEGDGGELRAIQDSGDLPFDTARVHYSAISDKLAKGGLPGNVYKALDSVREGMDQQLTQAAKMRGVGSEYTSLKASEHQFRSDWIDKDSPLAKAYNAPDHNYLKPEITGKGSDIVLQRLAKYRDAGAKPHLIAAARRMAAESKSIRNVPLPKEPGAAPIRPDIPSKRIGSAPDSGTLPLQPGIPEKPMPKSPELSPVKRPEPEPPKPSKTAKRVGRLVGKAVGATAGSAIGHPFLGYAAGGEIGEDVAEGLTKKKK